MFATEAEFVKWPTDFGLSVTSRLLNFLVKSLRAWRSVRLWINLDTDTPVRRMPISRTIANVLMRRRSLQLLSRLRRFRNFPGFRAVWTFNSKSRMLQPTHHPEILEFQRLLWYRITIEVGKSSQIVLPSHQQLLLPLQREAGPKCDVCQKTANCLPSLSISNLCLNSRDQQPCATKGARDLLCQRL